MADPRGHTAPRELAWCGAFGRKAANKMAAFLRKSDGIIPAQV